MFPVFSLVLDKDVKSEVAMLYPELYKDLLKVFSTGSHAGFQWIKRDDCDDFMSRFCPPHRVDLYLSRHF